MPEPVKVYVVDDEPVIASTLAAILNASGFRATSFGNAEDAIKAAELDGPSLLISDVMMPGMNGVDLAIHLKAMCPDCKVLLFSGHAATSGSWIRPEKQGMTSRYWQSLFTRRKCWRQSGKL